MLFLNKSYSKPSLSVQSINASQSYWLALSEFSYDTNEICFRDQNCQLLDLLYLCFLNNNADKMMLTLFIQNSLICVHDCFLFLVSQLWKFTIIGRQKIV